PEMEGYSFANWTASGDIYQTGYETIYNIAMGDITFTANYNVQKYRVRFYDGVNGNLINVQQVEYGQAATPPAHPEHEGYTFMGWDVDINCITENTDVHGICVPDSELEPTPEPGDDPIPGDVNGNGTLEVADAVEIARAALGLQQIDEAIADFDGNGRVEVADATLVIRAALGL
ncbi:MAG: InlB B-repeat-containing protein, partial [Christensenellaceae bacterium]|nr:InlB B-repeat-containing protein [Christensenellaceae bacterium]